jgi:hypothetical protein
MSSTTTTTTTTTVPQPDFPSQVDSLEADLKSFIKRLPQEERNSSQVLKREIIVRDGLANIIVKSCTTTVVESTTTATTTTTTITNDFILSTEERLWKHIIYKRIDAFRKSISATTNTISITKKLTNEFKSFLTETRDFYVSSLLKPLKSVQNKNNVATIQVAHHVCIRLGDIARYKEMVNDMGQKRWGEAENWYRRAIRLDSSMGLPHNQLAVLASYEVRHLIAIYQYERAMTCSRPFSGAKENLSGLFTTLLNQTEEGINNNTTTATNKIESTATTTTTKTSTKDNNKNPNSTAAAAATTTTSMSSSERATLKDAFMNRFLKFHAQIFLSCVKKYNINNDELVTILNSSTQWIANDLYVLLRNRCISGEGGETFVALCCISIFSCWISSTSSSSSTSRNEEQSSEQNNSIDTIDLFTTLSRRALIHLTLGFLRHAMDIVLENSFSPRLEKALVSVCILYDYLELSLNREWATTKTTSSTTANSVQKKSSTSPIQFEKLLLYEDNNSPSFMEMTTKLSTKLKPLLEATSSSSSSSNTKNDVIQSPTQNQELIGFIPLPSNEIVPVTSDQLGAILEDRMPLQSMSLFTMCNRICTFAKLLNRNAGEEESIAELLPYSAKGSVVQVLSHSDDEEEIILFQPAFGQQQQPSFEPNNMDPIVSNGDNNNNVTTTTTKEHHVKLPTEEESSIWDDEGLFVPSFMAAWTQVNNNHNNTMEIDHGWNNKTSNISTNTNLTPFLFTPSSNNNGAMSINSSTASTTTAANNTLNNMPTFQSLWGPIDGITTTSSFSNNSVPLKNTTANPNSISSTTATATTRPPPGFFHTNKQ